MKSFNFPEEVNAVDLNLFQGSRPPAAAGLFYPAEKNELVKSVHSSFLGKLGPGRYPETNGSLASESGNTKSNNWAECYIVPHAGLEYSGQVAANSYFRACQLLPICRKRLVAIILGPNHYGIGSGIALSPNETWTTPLGRVSIERDLSSKIASTCHLVDFDLLAHSREHSIEVQLPFLQTLAPMVHDLYIIPISLMLQDLKSMKDLASSICSVLVENYRLMANEENYFMILGSSDLTHYEPQAFAEKKDRKLLAAVESLDVLKYYSVLEREGVSACGYGAIAAVMLIAKSIGKSRGKVLRYATSGDVTQQYSSVVGYPSVYFL